MVSRLMPGDVSDLIPPSSEQYANTLPSQWISDSVVRDRSARLARMRDTPTEASISQEMISDAVRSGDEGSIVKSDFTEESLAITASGEIEQRSQGTRPPAVLVESFDGLGVGFAGPQGATSVRNPSDNSLAV